MEKSQQLSVSSFLYALLNIASIIAAALQIVIDNTAVNAWSVLSVITAALVTLQYLQRTHAFEDFPVSSLALLGLCMTTQLTSLFAQTLSTAPLIERLRVPQTTFPALLGVQMLSVVTHAVYRKLAIVQDARAIVSRQVFAPMGVFTPLSPSAIWAISLVGALSLAMAGAQTGDVGGKTIDALRFLAWLPLMIPILYARYGDNYCRMRVQVPALLGYALLLMIIGLALNGRTIMIVGPMQAALVLMTFGLRTSRPMTRRISALLGIGLVLSSIMIAYGRDLAIAVVAVRDGRSTLTPGQMVWETLAALGDRSKLELYAERASVAAEYEVYDEEYLSNPLLARFSQTKFHDNMFSMLAGFTNAERAEIAQVTRQKIVAVLPQPVIDKMGLDVNKENYRFSMGDVYRSLNESEMYLGGFVVGSIWADIWAIFGLWSPVVAAAILMVTFVLLDALSLKAPDGWLILSPIAVVSAWTIFLLALSEISLEAQVLFLLRGFPQQVLLFCLMAWIANRAFPWREGPLPAHPSRVSPLTP